MNNNFEYIYAWKNNDKRKQLYKKNCRILAKGKKSSILIEFENGDREITSRYAVKLK